MRLTNNFWLKEFLKSQTAIRKGIDNRIEGKQVDKLVMLCTNVLQPLRDHYGQQITVNSGFRSPELNIAIGGSKTSQHCKGEAADIDTLNDNAELFEFIRDNLSFDQLIWEFGNSDDPAWVHVSFKSVSKNRGMVLKAESINGKTHYANIT